MKKTIQPVEPQPVVLPKLLAIGSKPWANETQVMYGPEHYRPNWPEMGEWGWRGSGSSYCHTLEDAEDSLRRLRNHWPELPDACFRIVKRTVSTNYEVASPTAPLT